MTCDTDNPSDLNQFHQIQTPGLSDWKGCEFASESGLVQNAEVVVHVGLRCVWRMELTDAVTGLHTGSCEVFLFRPLYQHPHLSVHPGWSKGLL
eukprot:3333276-Rhodomonas_salina.3